MWHNRRVTRKTFLSNCSRDAIPATDLTYSLTVTFEADAVVPLPCGSSAGSQLVGCMALVSQTPVLLACACQATQLTVLVHWVDDPVDACILQSNILTSANAVMCFQKLQNNR